MTNRRLRKITSFAVMLTTLWGMAHAAETTATKRPNILYIMSDDHSTRAIGAYPSRLASLNPTPTIDKLAADGIVFDRAFCVNAICTPSRATILTGQYPQRNGVLDLNGKLPNERQHLLLEMRKAGYATAVIGKWHIEKEAAADYYCLLPGQGKYFDPTFITSDQGTINTKGHCTDIITDKTLDWLAHQRPTDKPFLLLLHHKAPHDMFENAPRYDSYLADVEIPEPENLYDQPGPNFGSAATRNYGSSVSGRNPDRNYIKSFKVTGNLSKREATREAYQRYLKQYLRCVKGVDDGLKRVFDYLEQNGLMENTVIFYTSDQGMFLGEHDFIDKRWMYDEAMQMPLIIRNPTGPRGVRNDWLINNTDFAPTILSLAGVKTPDYMQGHSFAAALRGESKPADWRTATYYRYWMHMASHHNPSHFGLRTDRFKLIFFYGCSYADKKGDKYSDTPAAWEFYDLQKDPAEMNNQYKNPEYAAIIADLKKQLLQQREELDETDTKFPKIQSIIDKHWND